MIDKEKMRSAGTVRHLFLKPEHNHPMQPVSQVTAVSGEDLKDDASHGRSKRQVLLIEQETLHEFGLAPGDIRENMVVGGLPLAGTPPRARWQTGEVKLEVTMDCTPCDFLDSLRTGLQRAISGRRGTLCRVIRGGIIRVGDSISLIP